MSRRIQFTAVVILSAAIVTAGHFWFYHPSKPLVKKNFTEDLLGSRPLEIKTPGDITLTFVGDIMLSRNVAAKIKNAGDPNLPFENLTDFLITSDYNVGNLESPFSGTDDFPPTGSLVFNAPTYTVEGLSKNNFQLLSLANNHALDQKLSGLVYTKEYLQKNGIKTIGAGKNLEEAWQPVIAEIKGVRIGFLAASYASANDGGKSRNDYVARIEDLKNLKSEILNLKSQVDIIIVLMHAGTEYSREPNPAQIKFAHAAIDFGADVVTGSHPHWTQSIELYSTALFPSPSNEEGAPSGKPGAGEVEREHTGIIFYSLGNFIFDQEWSPETKRGLAVKLRVKDKKLTSYQLTPLIIENYCCPRLADEHETKNILQSINATSTTVLNP